MLDFKKTGGLLPAIVQDVDTGAVLMLGYMNRAALHTTFERGRVVFYSRSKQRLWMKGESSGNFLNVVDIRVDCDRDTLLVSARPVGPACHRGTITCFGDDQLVNGEQLGFLSKLESIIEQRIAENPEGSYTARLFAQGPKRIAQKVGEEGLEVALAAVSETDDKVVSESADLLFHLLVLLKSRGVALDTVVGELQSRHATRNSG
ncbi:MAG: bifunctional phosphoribosyl-AMP cyclohydrolase/phosphoribosyl-ATP diphosphatase HisIE [Gammaproteobacteria bacterium]